MQVSRKDNTPTNITLTIAATADELQPIKDSVVARLGKNIKVQGFRAGKAPANILEKNIDPNMLQGDFLDEAMTQLYAKATKDEDLRPVTRPKVDIKKFVPFTELEFTVTTDIVGEITLPDYKKITVEKPKVAVTADDVKGVLDSLRTRLAEKKEVSRKAKANDEVLIDFNGVDTEGKPVSGADGKDYPLTLGSNAFIPGFEDELIGLSKDESKTFTITFPKDYGVAALASKDVVFTVKVNSINELQEPKADDEFAKKVGPFETLADLKKDIKEKVTLEREREASDQYNNELIKAIVAKTKVALPDELIDEQIKHNIVEFKRNLTYRGQTWEEYLTSEKITEDEYKEQEKPRATEQITASLVLSEIAEKEGLTIENDELDARISMLKMQYTDQAMQAELDKPENRRDIASRMLTEKVLDILNK
jgi:trigger factor